MLVLLALTALGQSLEDTPIEALTLRFDTRYDVIDWGRAEHRLQNSALVAFQVDLFAGIDLAGMASTGPRFTSRWSTWHDLRGDEPDRMALSLRQLYLERWFGDAVRLQAGALSPVKGDVSTSGLEDLGWIDGMRGEWHHQGFVLELVGGSLTDTDEPDLFIRRRELDYAEIELGQDLPRGFEVEVAAHLLGVVPYAKSEVGWTGVDADGRQLTLRLEGGVNLDDGATTAIASLRTDLGVLITAREGWEERAALRALCRWVDPAYGELGALSEDFYQFGTECRVRVSGKLDERGILGWDLRYIAPVSEGLLPRFDAALTAKLKLNREDSRDP